MTESTYADHSRVDKKGKTLSIKSKIRKVELAGPVGGAHAFQNEYRNIR